jgi:hypothetical protein
MKELKEHYNYAILKKDNYLLLTDNFIIHGNYINDRFLTDVFIEIKNGILYLHAKEHDIKFTLNKIKVKDLKEKPSIHDIKISKGCKWLGIKPYEYVEGWYAIPGKKEFNIIMNKFTIEIKD